jgi:hypothetical protein
MAQTPLRCLSENNWNGTESKQGQNRERSLIRERAFAPVDAQSIRRWQVPRTQTEYENANHHDGTEYGH